jgi:hypothetical protein
MPRCAPLPGAFGGPRDAGRLRRQACALLARENARDCAGRFGRASAGTSLQRNEWRRRAASCRPRSCPEQGSAPCRIDRSCFSLRFDRPAMVRPQCCSASGVRPGPGGVGRVPPGHMSASEPCAADAAFIFNRRLVLLRHGVVRRRPDLRALTCAPRRACPDAHAMSALKILARDMTAHIRRASSIRAIAEARYRFVQHLDRMRVISKSRSKRLESKATESRAAFAREQRWIKLWMSGAVVVRKPQNYSQKNCIAKYFFIDR